MAVVTTRAILLRAHPYGETSLVLRFFSEDLGTVGVMAKGVRKGGSRSGSGLETFAGGSLTAYVKEGRGLQTYKDFSAVRLRREMARDLVRFGGASVVGELVLRHGGEAAAPVLYQALEEALDAIGAAPPDALVPTILAAAWRTVATLGYHPVLEHCVECGRPLDPDELGRFDLGAGGLRCAGCSVGTSGPRVGPGAREQLAGLVAGAPVDVSRPRGHLRVLSDFVTYHVSGTRPLDSFRFLASQIPADPDDETPEAGGPGP